MLHGTSGGDPKTVQMTLTTRGRAIWHTEHHQQRPRSCDRYFGNGERRHRIGKDASAIHCTHGYCCQSNRALSCKCLPMGVCVRSVLPRYADSAAVPVKSWPISRVVVLAYQVCQCSGLDLIYCLHLQALSPRILLPNHRGSVKIAVWMSQVQYSASFLGKPCQLCVPPSTRSFFAAKTRATSDATVRVARPDSAPLNKRLLRGRAALQDGL